MIRNGRSTLGCLFTLLIVVAIGYFAVNAGESYWRFYQYQDTMQQVASFGRQKTNEQILVRRLIRSVFLTRPGTSLFGAPTIPFP